MKALAKLGTPTLAAIAAVGLAATTAHAATTTIRRNTATGAAYSGKIQVLNLGNMTFAGSFLGLSFTASCSTLDARGAIVSDGSSGSLNAVTVSGCSSSIGGTVTVTFQNLPYTHGTGTYAPVAGGRDGTLVFTDTNLKIKVVINYLGTYTCYYGFGGSVSSLTFDLFNRNNTHRPNPADEAQAQIKNATLDKLSGSSAVCPTGVTGNGIGKLRGEVTANSSVFDQKLYATS